jgi:hypothetical protein
MQWLRMRSLLIVCGIAGLAHADPDPQLWDGELRMGYGVAIGDDGGKTMTTRGSPFSIAAIAAVAINDEPPLWAFGGITLETLNRNSVGGVAGVRLEPEGTPLRFSVGGTYIIAPYTLWGALASGGYCHHTKHTFTLCGDVQLTSYFSGTDLPKGHMVTEAQLVFGMVIDGH